MSALGFVEGVFLADLCCMGLGLDIAVVRGLFVERDSFVFLGGIVSRKPCFILLLKLEVFVFVENHVWISTVLVAFSSNGTPVLSPKKW
jgi:hypothetical protein